MSIIRTQVRLAFPGGSTGGTNTWHLEKIGSGTDEDAMASAMGAVKTFYTTVSGQIWTVGYTAKWDGTGTTVEASPSHVPPGTPWTVTGSGTAQPSAAGVGAVISWRSSVASKRGRGRTFLCPLQVGAYDLDGSLTTGVRGGLQTAADALVTASQGASNYALVVYSPTDDIARVFISATASDTVAYLSSRRRL